VPLDTFAPEHPPTPQIVQQELLIAADKSGEYFEGSDASPKI